ncbi:hypothetical protein AB0K34_13700 [Actinomadura sp. NPDC049382]|uniref:hypothetical protein n=1 Tax=Actinomadura sp. NPDC049382 TaxID=3158220 RepID=UPI003436FD33
MSDRRHALIFNAITEALAAADRFVPLSARDGAARRVCEALGADDGMGWTRAISDDRLTALRLSCGHAKLAIRNAPIVAGLSTQCPVCGPGVTVTHELTGGK